MLDHFDPYDDAEPLPHDEKLMVANAMQRYGGGFMEALGEALIRADEINARKIRAAWPDDWNKYLAFGQIDRERKD